MIEARKVEVVEVVEWFATREEAEKEVQSRPGVQMRQGKVGWEVFYFLPEDCGI